MLITVQAAFYGTTTTGVDVTTQIEAMLAVGLNHLEINNANMGGDPDPGVVKSFAISYLQNGETKVRAAREGETLRFP